MTQPTRSVLDVLSDASEDEPVFGLGICEEADLGPGTVYPILERLAELGWVDSRWETEQPSGRPRRRYYWLTGVGRVESAAALAARAARRSRWTTSGPIPGMSR
ncbi:PadR family transcriptional regulator [Actinoplanes solisilvae]|uniref:PadR family transcriptional regulator n=1 Tax=Actinoplanes solisilvae TaxID=2486853 RepID=UPI000FDB35F5|nr:helix-turn-helix transcriptional regulator [Actinoplanes solisilvae]